MYVHITVFHLTGKFYMSFVHTTKKKEIQDIIAEATEIVRLPEFIGDKPRQDVPYILLINVQGHSYRFPILIIPYDDLKTFVPKPT